MKTLFDYYSKQKIRPTFAGFKNESELISYSQMRTSVFNNLMLPPVFFNEKRILEFGPDTGENSLVFAKWGATINLVEPNLEAHLYINDYFSKFNLSKNLKDIKASSLLDYHTNEKFDFIVAEGFIYSIQPTVTWINKLAGFINNDGFLIISYMDYYGSFFELLKKAIFRRVVTNTNYTDCLETAKYLFLPKWNTINHTRTIDSWYMDVIKNPFVRLKYHIDAVSLLNEMNLHKFRFYSSWPSYKDTLSMHWLKANKSYEEEIISIIKFIEQSRLSHLLGFKCFLHKDANQINRIIQSLLIKTDELIDEWNLETSKLIRTIIKKIQIYISDSCLNSDDNDLKFISGMLDMINSIFELMEKNNIDSLIQFCRNDDFFLSSWGTPNHYAIYQYR